MAMVLCPHCQYTFDYPTPQDIPNQGNEIIKLTSCPPLIRGGSVRREWCYNLGSTGSDSIANSANTHSCTRRNG
jgi:hypothetical protein